MVCSAKNSESDEKVAIKKVKGHAKQAPAGVAKAVAHVSTAGAPLPVQITNAFENLVDARRTLREMKLLRYLQ